MSKNIILVVILVSIFITGCNRIRTEENSIIEIRERMFLTQIQDIYMNINSYLGKTLRLEGIFLNSQMNGEQFYSVYRNSIDNCCGGGKIGFDVRWPEGHEKPFPETDSWVDVTGVLSFYQQGSSRFLYLELSSLRVMNTRGLEFVNR
ncbi:MAG: hypothetical protein LBC80_03215 [Treponema sp.]|jgi:uncharacterized membrane protein YcgQ (UPF0703/DUF1980 family)|nr:hypothetical protein [Treponema sp.]